MVVHLDHGIGRFEGFRRVEVEDRQLEMLVLVYRGGDNLLVPVCLSAIHNAWGAIRLEPVDDNRRRFDCTARGACTSRGR